MVKEALVGGGQEDTQKAADVGLLSRPFTAVEFNPVSKLLMQNTHFRIVLLKEVRKLVEGCPGDADFLAIRACHPA